ncbi:2-isopropylmalate synthase [Natranaerovirga hydrolytica]|uniref:2-isopropylmalate synthase n=1 Tax=Natranaerovirga hydrolytica TaxID=680378 RepID=A0A4R1N3M7_9FIRM|nr:2-isopropylmalate synthase [Natranaerovirga hydrolytica]TCL00064.1 2-isopropylmalate synthase [Natranaerovirga hydrolytica]
MKKIYVFDTTLRDGEQVPGAKLNLIEKVQIAKQLEKLNVDFMEVGFPSSSQGDFEAVKTIAKEVKNVAITGLGRAVKEDIDIIYDSLKDAENPLIHIVLGSSNIHMSKKFKKSPEQILQMGVDAVKYAKKYMPQVQYSLEDASRSDFEYIWQTIEGVVNAGATIVNVPDTVGFALPETFGEVIYKINDRLMNLNPEVLLSVHCHNDTGLGTANTLAAVRNGANKVECTINGIGERAGNTSLEEVVMGIQLHPDYYNGYTDINTKQIYETSRMVSGIMGLDVQVNKAITGENAFAHSSGIHQDGLLKSKDVYEIFEPETIGAPPMEIILTARSGKHAFEYVSKALGYKIPEEQLMPLHKKFLAMADEKKEIYYNDIINLLDKENVTKEKNIELWELLEFQMSINSNLPSATVKLKKGEEVVITSESGTGAVDALYSAIIKGVNLPIQLNDYRINSLSRGKESLGKATVEIRYNHKTYNGKAIEKDVMKASALALVNGINKMLLSN